MMATTIEVPPPSRINRLTAGRIVAQRDYRNGGAPRGRHTSYGAVHELGNYPSEHLRSVHAIQQQEAAFVAGNLPAQDQQEIHQWITQLEADLKAIYGDGEQV